MSQYTLSTAQLAMEQEHDIYSFWRIQNYCLTSSTVCGIKEEIWGFIYGSYTYGRGGPLLDDEDMAHLPDRGAN